MTTNPNHQILVQFQANLPDPDTLQREAITQAALQTLSIADQTAPCTISIIMATDEYMQELNLQFRQIDAPTDVLSFPTDPLPPEVQEAEADLYLGDMMIGVAYTARRAIEEGHAIQDEILLLVVHGCLHLLGYDHDTPEKQADMWAIQGQALANLGIHLDLPDYIHET